MGTPDSIHSRSWMSLETLSQAIRKALEASNLAQFDLIAFDACLMANYAVAAALAPYSPLLVASETNEYGGMQYEVRGLILDLQVTRFLSTLKPKMSKPPRVPTPALMHPNSRRYIRHYM